MPGLSNERIKELMAKKSAPRTRGGSTTKKKGNPNDRSYQSWFALEHFLLNRERRDMAFCENPNCSDPRDKTYGQTVTDVGGTRMCRFCFIGGWLLKNSNQTQL
jgi:hypothetical protein